MEIEKSVLGNMKDFYEYQVLTKKQNDDVWAILEAWSHKITWGMEFDMHDYSNNSVAV